MALEPQADGCDPSLPAGPSPLPASIRRGDVSSNLTWPREHMEMSACARIPAGVRLAIHCTCVGTLGGSLLFRLSLPWRGASSDELQCFRYYWKLSSECIKRLGVTADLDSLVLALRRYEDLRFLRLVAFELMATRTRLIRAEGGLVLVQEPDEQMQPLPGADDVRRRVAS